ncbi:diguanylate cyclase [Vibrio cholerae]|nr:diguanylate cyclase [Vibrio cholerae]
MFSVAITLLNAFYTVYRVQKELILSNTMESNWVYAEKMADMTDAFIDTAMSQLNFSANILSKKIGDTQVLDNEVERLRLQTNAFNSVVVVDSKGTIIAISPETLALKGVTLKQDAALQSLNTRAPLITDPFVSPSGNYITSISHPIYSEAGEYLGYVSGTLYLESQNILTRLLGKHSHQDGSYMYVVDRNKTIIYHPDNRRVGQVMLNNEAINAVVNREDGYGDIVNSQGVDMLAGYAPVKNSEKWPPIFGHDFKWSICFDSTQQYRDRL